MSGGVVLKTDSLSVGYKDKTVLRDIFLTVEKGRMICLLGPNGAGKSTVLHTLARLIEPIGGRIEMDGRELASISVGELAKKISVVLTGNNLPGLTTVRELVAIGRSPYTGFFGRLTEKDEELIDKSLHSVGAYDLRDRYCSELSDGEKQKIMIARALVQQPQLILLDEPTSHLDVSRKVEVMRILNSLAAENGIAVVMSMHDIDLAVKCSDYIVLIKNGSVKAAGTPEEIIKPGVIDELYDLKGAGYDEQTGAVELAGGSSRDLFVFGRAGTATAVMRAAARLGLGVGFGAAESYDIDAHTAKAVCIDHFIHEHDGESFESLYEKTADAAVGYRLAVDSGFPMPDGDGLMRAVREVEKGGLRVIGRQEYSSIEELIKIIKSQ